MPENDHDNVRDMWSEDELDRALAALRPEEDADDRAFHRTKAELMVTAGGREPVRAPEPGRPGRRRRWAWWVASAGTVAAMVASVLVVQTVQLGDTIPNAAADQLNSAAGKISAVDEPVAPGQYRYIATHAWWMASVDEYAYLAENLLETWVPADEKQDWLWRRDVTGARKWVSGTEAEARAAGFPVDESGWPEGEWRAPCGDWFAVAEGREPCAAEGSWQVPNAEFLAALPRDADTLHDRLRADTAGRGRDPDLEMVVYVADVLRTGRVPADLRAALYRALAKVPTLEITEQVANLDGVAGTAYGISADGSRHDIIVDRETGQFIGERQVTEEGYDNVPAGTVTSYTSVTTAVVPAMGVRPQS
ncbi:CU044_5270 family protein [Actinophytocola glycyrrhizae]|uniref:CU044_5270 family protein n=1 Tax=Actinophytocola glycyrrhizae TaxID=2044873 RepID=A0ABV9RYL0_9PSEU